METGIEFIAQYEYNFFCPRSKMGKLETFIEKMNRLSSKLGFTPNMALEILKETESKYTIDFSPFPITVKGYSVKVTGEIPRVEGWTPICLIEHTEAGNFVTSWAQYPELYRTAPPNCDHCGTAQRRKKTMVLWSESKGFIQVGLACLKDFTRSVNLARYMEVISHLDFTRFQDDEIDDRWYIGGSTEHYFSTVDMFSLALAVIEMWGYVSQSRAQMEQIASTANNTLDVYFNASNVQDSALKIMDLSKTKVPLAQDMINTVKEHLAKKYDFEPLNDYEHNIMLLVNSETYPPNKTGYLCSIYGFYNRIKDDQRKLERAEKEQRYLGEIGEKLVATVKVESIRPIDGYYGTTYICTFSTHANDTIVWFSSKEPTFDEGDSGTLTGKIKDHKMFRDTKQTIVTRCKMS